MKITLNKNITIGDKEKAQQIIKDFNDQIEPDDLWRAARLYLSSNYDFKIYEIKAEVSYNSAGIGLLSEEETFNTYKPLDIYISCFAKSSEICGDLHFYLSDFWQLADENRNQIREKAYTVIFKKA